MPEKLKILILEDNPADAELMKRELRRAGINFTAVRTDDESSFRQSLVELEPDVVLSDYALPTYDGAEAMLATSELRPEALFIFVSGVMGEEAAVEALKQGATDYILKDHLPRLPSAVEKAIRARDEESRRRNAEAALIENEKRFRSLAESAVDAIITADSNMKIVFWNKSAQRIFGYREDEIKGKEVLCMVPERFRNVYRDTIHRASFPREGVRAGKAIESTGVRKDGREVPIEISLSAWETGEGNYVTAIIRDVSERKRAEESIRRMNRSLMVLSEGNEALVRATGETGLLSDVCRVIVETGGYRMAWSGYLAKDALKTVEPVAWAGHEDGFLDSVRIAMTIPELRDCPTVKAIRLAEPALAPDFSGQACEPWRTEILKRGYRSCIALPLMKDGSAFGAMTLYTGEPAEFDKEEVELLMELAKDLSYGIHSLRARALQEEAQRAVKENLAILQQFTGGIIQAMAMTVETRDPYTAGHQRRVADLAAAIGREMGVSSDELEGIRTAGAIHDLGKIHVPSEILSKPGQLTPLERGIIMAHPQVGYEILKEIDFPWPIAEIVLQHHERMDGSGYPRGFHRENILREARILSVADVAEAMSSHRPYRPALGISNALAEISGNRGVLYDPLAVNACLRLFNEKGYAFDRAPETLTPVA